MRVPDCNELLFAEYQEAVCTADLTQRLNNPIFEGVTLGMRNEMNDHLAV